MPGVGGVGLESEPLTTTTTAKLSPIMQAALGAVRDHGRLERWENGFWTYAGCPARMVKGMITPDLCFTWQTIKGLIERELVAHGDGYLVEVFAP